MTTPAAGRRSGARRRAPRRCWRRPLASVTGQAAGQPGDHDHEKNTPIDNAVPEFWKVERIPEAAPRRLAGTLPMIEEELGAANIPLPIPFTAMSSAKARVRKAHGQQHQADEAAAEDRHPGGRDAAGTELVGQKPATGRGHRNPAVRGSRKMPAHSGVWRSRSRAAAARCPAAVPKQERTCRARKEAAARAIGLDRSPLCCSTRTFRLVCRGRSVSVKEAWRASGSDTGVRPRRRCFEPAEVAEVRAEADEGGHRGRVRQRHVRRDAGPGGPPAASVDARQRCYTILGNGVGGTVGDDSPWSGARVVASLNGTGGYAERAVATASALIRIPDELATRDAVALLADGRHGARPGGPGGPARGRYRPGRGGGRRGGHAAGADRPAGWGPGRGAGQPAAQARPGPGPRRRRDRRTTAATAGRGRSATWSGEVDVVFDGVGGDIGLAAFGLLGAGGRFCPFGMASGRFAPVTPELAQDRQVTVQAGAGGSPEHLAALARMALAEAGGGTAAAGHRPGVRAGRRGPGARGHRDQASGRQDAADRAALGGSLHTVTRGRRRSAAPSAARAPRRACSGHLGHWSGAPQAFHFERGGATTGINGTPVPREAGGPEQLSLPRRAIASVTEMTTLASHAVHGSITRSAAQRLGQRGSHSRLPGTPVTGTVQIAARAGIARRQLEDPFDIEDRGARPGYFAVRPRGARLCQIPSELAPCSAASDSDSSASRSSSS